MRNEIFRRDNRINKMKVRIQNPGARIQKNSGVAGRQQERMKGEEVQGFRLK